ncbi:response regulator [Segetibacter aerophilus]|nr:response regulator [Segetibacter aerophilus]
MSQSVPNPIILIDDDPDDLELFASAFNELEIVNEVVTFNNGYDALEFLKNSGRQPLFILCDINMPKVNGLDLRQMIYDDMVLRQKSIPFLFLSTADDRIFVDKAYNLAVQGYFKKPAHLGEIKEMLKAIIIYWRHSHHPNSRNKFITRTS